MITTLKILLTIAVLLILAFPFIPIPDKLLEYAVFQKLKHVFPASALRYDRPHNRKNLFFVLLAVIEFIAVAVVFRLLDRLAWLIRQVPYIDELFTDIIEQFSSQLDFILFALRFVLINFVFIYLFIILKSLLKRTVLDPLFRRLAKKREEEKKAAEQKAKKDTNAQKTDPVDPVPADPTPEDDDDKRDHQRISKFTHSDDGSTDDQADDGSDRSDEPDKPEDPDKPKKPEYKKLWPVIARFLWGIFFEGENFSAARKWVRRVRTVLQCFIVLIEILYLLFIATVLTSMFFPLPLGVYTFLIDTLQIGDWYLYPAISLLFLQEICNFFRTRSSDPSEENDEKKKEETKKKSEEKKLEVRLGKLLAKLKKYFDAEHSLRYYPEVEQSEIPEYVPKNRTYLSAMEYIRKHMQATSGRVVQSYMQCLDASFNDDHVYFASSFYSELGEYLVAYTYIRLLAGSRMVFIVSDPDERATLRSFIGERLMQLTGSSPTHTWRIYTANERLDQADILIACPEDFRDSDLTSHNPAFFEEVSNAVFLDADRMISLDSYLCPVMATRLQRSTGNRIRFIFLTKDLYKGFAARSLPKFFCAEPILTFSSAKENESVSYVLWNRESKSHRIYNKHGQKTTSLECMIADLACEYKIDGVRVITESPLDHAEHKILNNRGVEVNKLYRDVADVNYMIYSDDRCNLAASIYACTRFRGCKKSVVHILSKPYLLREYFISKASIENFVNRSSFIQPRVLEHVDPHKLSLLRLFCELTSDSGLPVSEFEKQMRTIINVCRERGDIISSVFCKRMIDGRKAEELKTGELAAYIIAGLCDNDVACEEKDADLCADRSAGNRAKEFYLIIDPAKQDGYSIHREKYIVFNRVREVFDNLFLCNERVELRLNDEIIGYLDTFPIRTHLEYIAGQSILYQNSEYEIEHISPDGRVIYLRSENVKISHCLDTVHLRRYEIESLVPIPKRIGILNNTKLLLEEIRVSECVAQFKGETYGFYGLTSDRQTLDFYHKDGVYGNPHVTEPHIRNFNDGRILRVDMLTRMECTDGMRLLLAAVFNEFARTIFPKAYHFISIVPILAEPLPFDRENEPKSELERIKALYPYLQHPKEAFVESDPHRISLLIINDCHEDIGAFQWFYDLSGRYMQEFLANVYSYLHWLQLRPNKAHYIYFGGESLPECYDLEGCCQLLEGFNLILSDLGKDDIETAGDDLLNVKIERCSFCHREMESGRYSLFDNARYICVDCLDVVDNAEYLEELHGEMREYLSTNYPDVTFEQSKAALDPVYDLTADQVLSEYYYRVDFTDRTVFAERDEPADNVCVSLLRGIIELWQADNEFLTEYAMAQLYYEELRLLRHRKLDESADWIYHALPDELRAQVDEISSYTGHDVSAGQTDKPSEDSSDDPSRSETDDTTDDPSRSTDTDTDTPSEDEDKDAENGVEPNAPDTDESDPSKADDDSSDEDQSDSQGTEDDTAVRTSFDFMRMKNAPSDDDKGDGDNFFGDDDFAGLYDPNKIPRFWKRYLRGAKLDTGRQEEIPDDADDPSDEIPDDRTADSEDPTKKLDGSQDDQSAKGKKRKGLFKRRTAGEKILPYEEDEKTNPHIRIYNELVRRAYDYSEAPIERGNVSLDDYNNIIHYVTGDYPELFWLTRICHHDSKYFYPVFRCKDSNDKLDVKQINQKRKELKRAAKQFTKGISRKTDPYTALTTIYRRLILQTDYDSVGLDMGIDKDLRQDDQLRSLHSSLVRHKVVCAGYAVAMQYLLQSVGIVCGYVISELKPDSTVCHAFNILKLGKYCYYLDATWGDSSNTKTGNTYSDYIGYDYFCVPYDEFLRTHPSQVRMHIPNSTFYPKLENFKYSNHEYFRFRNAYLLSYNEGNIIRIIADAALAYDEKEMGEFRVGIRFASAAAARQAYSMLNSKNRLRTVISRAKETVSKKSRAELLDRDCQIFYPQETGVLNIRFTAPAQESKKKR